MCKCIRTWTVSQHYFVFNPRLTLTLCRLRSIMRIVYSEKIKINQKVAVSWEFFPLFFFGDGLFFLLLYCARVFVLVFWRPRRNSETRINNSDTSKKRGIKSVVRLWAESARVVRLYYFNSLFYLFGIFKASYNTTRRENEKTNKIH